ncbi:CRM-domain containing factor CFM9, mitochondrial [Cornus florida]|uniref:CRM-domain containing factor CFM9, mitochondrial n=1 Tax=Cornus florida TaxID=4283 RepID=UPI00289EEF25|nr:CRM-domain containing factor CFM9, mitochondrial [Cornus florida]
MFAARSLQRNCFKTISSLILTNPSKNVMLLRDNSTKIISSNVIQSSLTIEDVSFSPIKFLNCFDGSRAMSTSKGRSMRSKVESRMRKESGKTLREIRRAKKLRKKLMTDEERLIYNLRRAKKKVALLLQKLKKYELPELPPSRHDPELLTPEQLQAYRKIGFRNKNYVPVGVRGVFGGVVQNMHLHWKFHETVQVCCDNFPKEKIKEMATMLARLSGGIVINVHNVKTIIMFRGRNYRQPKNLIPLNTLTKRKALFKARFEQALDSQKLNIKKLEQELRRMGVNPEDPVAMASIQRVASTFFNAIDKKGESPYVFVEDKSTSAEPSGRLHHSEPADDSDQEELDKFIAEIEDAADKEWAAEEEAEKEEFSQIRYRNREDLGGRFRRSEMGRSEDSDNEFRGGPRGGGPRGWKDTQSRRRVNDSEDDEDDNISEDDGESNDVGDASDADYSDEARGKRYVPKVERWQKEKIGRANNNGGSKRNVEDHFKGNMAKEDSLPEDTLSDLEDAIWESDDEEHDSRESRTVNNNYRSSSDEDDFHHMSRDEKDVVNRVNDLDSDADDFGEAGGNAFKASKLGRREQNKIPRERYDGGFQRHGEAKMSAEDSGSETQKWESDTEEKLDLRRTGLDSNDYRSNSKGEDYPTKNERNGSKVKSPKQVDETWDSD